ncbi:LPO_1073/Vpar_1526 family protein [Clostridium perfringens]|uniref:LPO_1073/Vpar_1526 family protein n=1 Tax=Clostridium perfringens TaxID=1502 RepID=UPI0013E37A29|nr:LPO_1073/Vpar_1526 family protein [Clostridium perfringens]MDK0636270.1 hypothetical protein [Clostridium perfringens]MDU4074383.1 hypothetical protein [Clostridium perfringens]NGS97654.1 hypothetical protein [Clostridium perfringens]
MNSEYNQEQNNSCNYGNFVSGNGNSTGNMTNNIQIVSAGLSYTDVKNICLDLFRENFINMKREANTTIEERIEEFTEAYIGRIKNLKSEVVEELKNPDMQYILYEGQKGYALNGNEELLERLIFLLSERTQKPQKDLIQLNLDEAITIVHKITEKQHNLLTIAFLIGKSTWEDINDLDELVLRFKEQVIPFIPCEKNIANDLKYLEYLGCGNLLIGDKLEKILKLNYPNIFKDKASEDIKTDIINKYPEMKKLFDLWNDTGLKTYTLTTVGITLGWVNYSNKFKITVDLGIWLS